MSELQAAVLIYTGVPVVGIMGILTFLWLRARADAEAHYKEYWDAISDKNKLRDDNHRLAQQVMILHGRIARAVEILHPEGQGEPPS